MSKKLSAKYYQENKERLEKKPVKDSKIFLMKKRKKATSKKRSWMLQKPFWKWKTKACWAQNFFFWKNEKKHYNNNINIKKYFNSDNFASLYKKYLKKLIFELEKFSRVSVFRNIRKAFFWKNIRCSFGAFVSWSIRNFHRADIFNFLSLAGFLFQKYKFLGFPFPEIQGSTNSWDKRNVLILETENSIFQKYNSFFYRVFFSIFQIQV